MNRTRIPYADVNWPIVTGCSRGCPYCWARALAHRFGRRFAPTFNPDKLAAPLRWRKPRRVLVAFTGDLFDPAITDKQIAAAWGVMAACPQHRFFVLTKQAERMAEWFKWMAKSDDFAFLLDCAVRAHGLHLRMPSAPHWPVPNVWLGVSVTNQTDADERIPHLLRCPAAIHWISAEPLLGPINLHEPYSDEFWGCSSSVALALDWVVAGAQSGPDAAPCDLAWVRDILRACNAEDTPFAWKDPTGYPLLDGVRHDAAPGFGVRP